MSLGITRGAGVSPRAAPAAGRAVRGLPRSLTKIRADLFRTAAAELDTLLAAVARRNAALVIGHELDTLSALDGREALDADEDELPELLGEDGAFENDPDGDFSETPADDDGHHSSSPDLIVEERMTQGDRRRTVRLGFVPDVFVRRDKSMSAQEVREAEWYRDSLEIRCQHVLHLGEIVLDRQRAFFESDSLETAITRLRPLTRAAAARVLRIDASNVGRLLHGTTIETPRFGRLHLRLFFGGRSKSDDVRNDVLAGHVRRLMEAMPGRSWTAQELRLALEAEGIIPSARTTRQKESMERRLRRARAQVIKETR